MGISDHKQVKLPDNVSLLLKMADKGFLIGTPSQDYDDSYCIQYAKKEGGHIMSNDKFRDYIQKAKEAGTGKGEEERKWVREHLISYTFSG
jgi:hypothetical protein